MKKLSVLFAMFLIVSGMTMAQERGGGQRPSQTMQQGRPGGGGQGRQQMNPEEMLQRQTQRLVEELKLNKEQEAKVTAINKKYMEKQPFDMSKMRDASDEERAKMREAMTKVQAERDKEIKAVLTADQLKKYEELQKNRESMMRGGRQGGPQGGTQGRNR